MLERVRLCVFHGSGVERLGIHIVKTLPAPHGIVKILLSLLCHVITHSFLRLPLLQIRTNVIIAPCAFVQALSFTPSA